jgi:prevent-host-death family protein
MDHVNMHDAKTRLSQLVDAVESGREAEIIIARNGKPAARLVPIAARKPVRLGLAKGQYKIPSLAEWNKDDAAIAAAFDADRIWPGARDE